MAAKSSHHAMVLCARPFVPLDGIIVVAVKVLQLASLVMERGRCRCDVANELKIKSISSLRVSARGKGPVS